MGLLLTLPASGSNDDNIKIGILHSLSGTITAVISTINGDANTYFYRELAAQKWMTLAQPFELLHRVIIAPRHGIDLSRISLSHSGYPLRQRVCEIVLFRARPVFIMLCYASVKTGSGPGMNFDTCRSSRNVVIARVAYLRSVEACYLLSRSYDLFVTILIISYSAPVHAVRRRG